MAEKETEFVVTDRRKYRMDGDSLTANPDHKPAAQEAGAPAENSAAAEIPAQKTAEAATLADEPAHAEELVAAPGSGDASTAGVEANPYGEMPPPPTEEQTNAANHAYQQTTERLDDLVRANDLGGKREAPVDFVRVAQSFYLTAMLQLGFNTPPNQQIRVDLLGARQTIDMLAVVAAKTKGNLSEDEDKLLQSMLFELRMGFLEMAQAVAQSAQAQQQAAGANRPGGAPAASGGRVTPFPATPRR